MLFLKFIDGFFLIKCNAKVHFSRKKTTIDTVHNLKLKRVLVCFGFFCLLVLGFFVCLLLFCFVFLFCLHSTVHLYSGKKIP